MKVSLSMVTRVQLKKECLYIMISMIIYSSYCPFEDGGKRRDSDIKELGHYNLKQIRLIYRKYRDKQIPIKKAVIEIRK